MRRRRLGESIPAAPPRPRVVNLQPTLRVTNEGLRPFTLSRDLATALRVSGSRYVDGLLPSDHRDRRVRRDSGYSGR